MSKSKAFLQKIADDPPPCVEVNNPEEDQWEMP